MELNKIYLGDCMELIKEIPDKSIDLIVTDPPYELDVSKNTVFYNKRKFLKELQQAGITKGFNYNVLLQELVRVMKKINIYIYCNKKQVPIYLKFFEALKTSYDFLLWEKENPAPMCGTHYLIDKEYCLYFWESGAPVHIPYERGKTIYRSKTNVADKEIYKHPTIKNIEMVETLILNSSQPGGVVLDPFIGSGTTARAAKNLGRQYIGFEINPEYYKIACDRLNGIDAKGQLNLFEMEKDYE